MRLVTQISSGENNNDGNVTDLNYHSYITGNVGLLLIILKTILKLEQSRIIYNRTKICGLICRKEY